MSAIFKAVFAIGFLSSALGRPINTRGDITFVNNCGKDVKILKYAMLRGGTFKCDITEPEDVIIVPSGTHSVPAWSATQSFADNSVVMFDTAGSTITPLTYAEISAQSLRTTCEMDPPFVEYVPVSNVVYMCSFEASMSPSLPEFAPAPAPSTIQNVIVDNQCANDVMIGNMYRTADKTLDYDIRCAPYSTLSFGESMYLDIPTDEQGFFSAYEINHQKNAVITSSINGEMKNGNYLGLMTDPNKSHIECDNQLKGNDLWYEYNTAGDYITITC